MPGVSIRWLLASKSYISENVVVCMPLWCADETSETLAWASGIKALINVDFPTPELPDSKVVLLLKISDRRSGMLCASVAVMHV